MGSVFVNGIEQMPAGQTEQIDKTSPQPVSEQLGLICSKACTCCCKHRHKPRPAGKHCAKCKGH